MFLLISPWNLMISYLCMLILNYSTHRILWLFYISYRLFPYWYKMYYFVLSYLVFLPWILILLTPILQTLFACHLPVTNAFFSILFTLNIVLLIIVNYKFGFRFFTNFVIINFIRKFKQFTFLGVITEVHLFFSATFFRLYTDLVISFFPFERLIHLTNEKCLNIDVKNQNTLSKTKTQVTNWEKYLQYVVLSKIYVLSLLGPLPNHLKLWKRPTELCEIFMKR